MVESFDTKYQAIIGAIEDKIGTVSTIKTVYIGKRTRVADSELPLAFIIPQDSVFTAFSLRNTYLIRSEIDIVVYNKYAKQVMTSADYKSFMGLAGDIANAFRGDSTLGGTCRMLFISRYRPDYAEGQGYFELFQVFTVVAEWLWVTEA